MAQPLKILSAQEERITKREDDTLTSPEALMTMNPAAASGWHGGTRGCFGPSVNLSNEWQSSRSPTPTSPAEKTFRQVA
jgi:hypothetical protein